jgi:hypothetical protein
LNSSPDFHPKISELKAQIPVATVIYGTGEVIMHLSQSNKKKRVLAERIARKENHGL